MTQEECLLKAIRTFEKKAMVKVEALIQTFFAYLHQTKTLS